MSQTTTFPATAPAFELSVPPLERVIVVAGGKETTYEEAYVTFTPDNALVVTDGKGRVLASHPLRGVNSWTGCRHGQAQFFRD